MPATPPLKSDPPPGRLLPNECACGNGGAAPLLTLTLVRNPAAAPNGSVAAELSPLSAELDGPDGPDGLDGPEGLGELAAVSGVERLGVSARDAAEGVLALGAAAIGGGGAAARAPI